MLTVIFKIAWLVMFKKIFKNAMIFQVDVRWYFRWLCDDKIAMILRFPFAINKSWNYVPISIGIIDYNELSWTDQICLLYNRAGLEPGILSWQS